VTMLGFHPLENKKGRRLHTSARLPYRTPGGVWHVAWMPVRALTHNPFCQLNMLGVCRRRH
jgi:hypothetical protein